MGLFDFTQAASDPNNPNAILAPAEVQRRQAMADAMTKQGLDYSPVASPWQGAARLADVLAGSLGTRNDTAMTQAGRANNQSMLAQLLGGTTQPQSGGASQPQAQTNTGAPNQITQSALSDPMTAYRNSISKIESGGNYGALGPATSSGDRAYGKYQVMGSNVGPWTAQDLGKALTPEQFLANPQAQDAVFNKQFGSYLQNGNSPQDAASMWFTGRPLAQGGNAQDILGTTGNQYASKFMAGLPNSNPSANASMPAGLPNAPANGVAAATTPNLMAQGVAAFQPPAGQGAPMAGAQPQINPASAPAPTAPQPQQMAQGGAISVPGYSGQFTQAQANDGDGVPSQAEWAAASAAASKGAQQPQVAATSPQQPQGAAMAPQGPPQINMQKMLAYLNDPYTSPQMAQVASQILQHQMSQQDPANVLALKKSGIELNNLEHPDQVPMTPYQKAIVDYRNAPSPPSVPSGYKMNSDGTMAFIPGGPADPKNNENTPTAPSGYRTKPDGTLEAIPGGPADPDGGKSQDKLEQQFRGVVSKELSNRSGGLGLQDAKVNQAIHLRALIDQYKQTDAQGNVTYNIPTSQYHELAMGLASLISPSGQTSDADRAAINAHTAAGDYNGAIQYITGAPQNGNTQAMTKNLIDSTDRQGTVAEQERGTYLNAIKQMAPTGLDPKRRDALMSGGLNSYVNRPGAQSAQAAAPAGDPLAQARAAITAGAPRDAVIQRLKQSGIDARGL